MPGVIPFAEDTPMPLQNRVTPSGEIVADPSRGLLMGNRGCLHGQGRTLGVSRWRSKLWICCLLDYKGVQRDPMPPGRWTALFFLDEATALSAGHRPCAYCRRPDYLAFTQACRANVADLPDGVMVRLGREPGLLIGGRVHPWSFRGYGAPAPAEAEAEAEV